MFRKIRASVFSVLLAALIILFLLAWRGMMKLDGRKIPTTIKWREADDADMF